MTNEQFIKNIEQETRLSPATTYNEVLRRGLKGKITTEQWQKVCREAEKAGGYY